MEKKTLTAEQFSKLLPKSNKFVSEDLSPENLAVLNEELAELVARNEAQQLGNTQLKTDFDAKVIELSSATTEVAQLKTKEASLNARIVDLLPYKEQVEKIQSKGKELPKEDAGSRETQNALPANHPNQVALAAFKQQKGIV